MGSVSAGTGLMSGLDIKGIVTSLMKIEHKPVDLLQSRIKLLNSEKSSYMSISAQLLALKLTVTPFKSAVTFRPNIASSSNEDILSAKANSEAVPGSYTFAVRQLAQAHQMVSKGFNDADKTPVGTGTISIEFGKGNLDRDTDLSFLNGQQGIRQGQIQITDRSGHSAVVDLSSALSLSDVLDTINGTSGINVTASVSGDSLILKDNTGSTVSNLIVADVDNGHTAEDLGIKSNVAADSITGSDIVGIADVTPLKFLNDGNGVGTSGTNADINIALRDGTTFDVGLSGLLQMDMSLDMMNNGEGVRSGSIDVTNKAGVQGTIDLSGAQTIQDVVQTINSSGLSLNASIVSSKLLITDSSGGDGDLKIEDADGSHTATDLRIKGDSSGTSITGGEIYSVKTMGDVIRAIEDAAHRASNPDKLAVEISSDGNSINLIDSSGGSGNLTVTSLNDSGAAESLGIAKSESSSTITGNKILAGLNTVLLQSLNGGSGVAGGTISIQDRSGASTQVDLSSATTVQDVIDAINNASSVNVSAGLNSTGTGILITDQTGSTASNLVISDVDSTTAADLGITVDGAVDKIDAKNNQLQYISRSTLLSSLNEGKGVRSGSFTIVDSTGQQALISVASNELDTMTVGDLMDKINSFSDLNVTASINNTGDGILLTDTGAGAGTLKVMSKNDSSTASDLNLAGEASTSGSGQIDGSFEYTISVGGSDTLQSLADKINALGVSVNASVINDGTDVNAYRLSLSSLSSGKSSRMLINSSNIDLGLFDLVKPQDAIISIGGASGGNSIVASSDSNTFTNTIGGLSLTAHQVSTTPVTIAVKQDLDNVVKDMNSFVDAFNKVIKTMADATKYDADTKQAGTLLGDYSVDIIRDRVFSGVRKTYSSSNKITRLSQLGISVQKDGTLALNEDKFRDVYASNQKAIESFFSTKDSGFGAVMDKTLDDLTKSYDGMIAHKTKSYDERIKMYNDRISYMEDLLKNKEQLLYKKYYAMENALAGLQSMQSALSSLTPVEPMNSNSGNKSSK